METFLTLHNEAMDAALQGDMALQSGDKELALRHYTKAYETERQAAYMAEKAENPEPGLSILFLSASSLAYQCGLLREAERLATHALSGNPPKQVASDLRDMLQQIYSSDAFSDEDDNVSYKVNIQKGEATLFATLVERMGWSASVIRKSVGKIAML